MQPEPLETENPEAAQPTEVAEPVASPVVEPVATASRTELPPIPSGPFHSLYESFGGTLTAVTLGVLIIVGIQFIVGRIFNGARTMSDSLTTFATAMGCRTRRNLRLRPADRRAGSHATPRGGTHDNRDVHQGYFPDVLQLLLRI